MEPRGRLRGRRSISCKPLCVSRVFGSYFKFRQKRAERLPGKQCSAGTDLALCLWLHKNSLQRCWIEVGPISCSDKARCLWLRSIIASFTSSSPPPPPHPHQHHWHHHHLISLHASQLGMRGDSSVWRVEMDDSSRQGRYQACVSHMAAVHWQTCTNSNILQEECTQVFFNLD